MSADTQFSSVDYAEHLYMANGLSSLNSSEQSAIDVALHANRAVGIIAGSYDDARTVSMASSMFLDNLGYSPEEFATSIPHVLKEFVYEEDYELFDRVDFKNFEGNFEFRMLNKAGECLYTYGYKTDSIAANGEQQWVISARVSRETVATHQLIKGLDRLVARYVICDIPKNTYSFFVCGEDEAYMTRGVYATFAEGMAQELNITSRLDSLNEAMAPQRVRRELKAWDNLYRYDYAAPEDNMFYRMSVMPVTFEDGELTQFLVLVLDVTIAHREEMRARQALIDACEAANEANESKTQFLSNMSHDIRTPMNAIIGMTAIASAHIDDKERVLDALGKITTSSRHLLSLINEVLDMSRIERGRMSLNDENFSLPELVDNMIEMVKPSLLEREQEFDVRIQNIEHENVIGDSLRIQQVFTNVMGNAIKYTPEGGTITLSIAEKPTQHAGIGYYEIVVEDSGIGMDSEFVSRIFDPFARADNATEAGVQGTGLGMSIAKNIVNMMNGDIKVESELNKGTKVTVGIFLRLQDTSNTETIVLGKLPVLVVDDDTISCESTVETLESIGMQGEWVDNGPAAIKRVDECHTNADDFYAVILDWKMPGMDGIECARQIRSIVGPDIPILMLTAYDFGEIEEEARAVGVNCFVSKPLFKSRLKNAFMLLGKKDEPAQKTEATVVGSEPGEYEGKRILVVEDNMLNREIMLDILADSGAELETAVNGKIAVDMVSAAPEGYYDLVFMDIQMPVMNGYEATMAIRALSSGKGATLPIIALTANAFAEDVVMAKNAGVNEHLAKPVDLAKLGETMKTWLK